MTTKEQERKALAQIKKIVEGLGEDSYIGAAFEGCFKIAEDNIDYDMACSMKDHADYFEKAANSYAERLSEVTKELDEAKKTIEIQHNNENEWIKAYNETTDSYHKVTDERDELLKNLEAKDLEIVRLKARLFDLIDKQ